MPFMHDRELGFPRNSFWVLIVLFLPAGQNGEALWRMAVGVVLGALWQVVYRRDLAHRLSALSVFWVFGIVLVLGLAAFVGSAGAASTGDGDPLPYLASVVSGLVLCELALRVRDDRRASSARAAARESVPARP